MLYIDHDCMCSMSEYTKPCIACKILILYLTFICFFLFSVNTKKKKFEIPKIRKSKPSSLFLIDYLNLNNCTFLLSKLSYLIQF